MEFEWQQVFSSLNLASFLPVFQSHYQSLLLATFSRQRFLMVFHCNLSYRKSRQPSEDLLSIMVDLSITEVWIVLARPPISISSSLLTKSLEIVPRTPITLTFIIHNFFQLSVLWQRPSTCCSFCLFWFSAWTAKSYLAAFFFC